MGRSKKKQSTTSQTTRSPWLTEGSKDAVSRARGIAGREYSAYGGQRVADMSENERMGIDMGRSNVGAWQGDFDSARAQLEGVGSITDEGALDGYFNPYMEQVVSPTLRRRNEAFEAERAERRAGQGMRSAFGGRSQMWENQFERDFQRDQDEFMGEAYGRAFNVATDLYGQEQDRRIRMAGAYQDLGTQAQQQRRSDLRDLMSTGLVERTREQADLDFKYLEHLEARDWDINNLDTLVKTLQSVPHDVTQTSDTVTEDKPSALKSVAGIGAIAAGAILTGGASLAAGGTFLEGMGAALTGNTGSVYGALFDRGEGSE